MHCGCGQSSLVCRTLWIEYVTILWPQFQQDVHVCHFIPWSLNHMSWLFGWLSLCTYGMNTDPAGLLVRHCFLPTLSVISTSCMVHTLITLTFLPCFLSCVCACVCDTQSAAFPLWHFDVCCMLSPPDLLSPDASVTSIVTHPLFFCY